MRPQATVSSDSRTAMTANLIRARTPSISNVRNRQHQYQHHASTWRMASTFNPNSTCALLRVLVTAGASPCGSAPESLDQNDLKGRTSKTSLARVRGLNQFRGGFQFWTIVIGAVASSSRVLIKNRPSRATSY